MTLTPLQRAAWVKYRPLALSWVDSYTYRRIPESAHDDARSDGLLGLLDAIRSYDPTRATSFEAYARRRVIGAAIDGLRAQDWVPRSVRLAHAKIRQACAIVEQRTGRHPTHPETAAQLGITTDELATWYAQIDRALIRDLEHEVSFNDGATAPLIDVVADPGADPAARTLKTAEIHELAAQVAQLPPRERLVIHAYYWGEQTLSQIGRTLGVTESRVSQLHTKALSRLRPALQDAA